MTENTRKETAQGALEYILLLGGVILVATLVILFVRKVIEDAENSTKCRSDIALNLTCYSGKPTIYPENCSAACV
jgi:hypothetical protein